jgi:hypothetical protein
VLSIAVTATVVENPTISSFPFIEGFETGNTNGSTTIKNWTQILGAGSKYWTANSTNTTYNRTPRTGSFNNTLGYGGNSWLFRPISLVADVAYEMELYARQDYELNTHANIGMFFGTEATIAAMTNTIAPQTPLTWGDYQRVAGTFTPTESGLYYIGIHGVISSSPWYLSLDDIKIRVLPTVPEFSITPDVTEWTFPSTIINTTATKQFTLANSGAGTLEITSVEVTGAGYTLSVAPAITSLGGATPSTTFTVQYAPTAAGVNQAGTLTINYSTGTPATKVINLFGTCVDPRITSLPHTQNFDAVVTPNLPLGWSANVYSASSPTYVYVRTATSTPQSAPNNVVFYNSGDTAPTLILASPQVTVGINNVKLSFWARWSSYSSSIIVGTMSDPANAATFTAYSTIPLTSTNTQYTVSFADYLGSDQYIAFKSVTPTTYSYIYLDTVAMNQILANDLAVTGLTGNSYAFQNNPVTYTVTVRNEGTAAQSNYTVYLKSVETRAILAQQTFAATLEANASNPVALQWTPASIGAFQIYGEVVLAGDQVAVNNVSENLAVSVYPEGILVEGFEADTFPPAGWTVVNGGDLNTWTRYTTGPRTGLACASIAYDATVAHDDWLITPRLAPVLGASTISFWAKNGSTTYIDLFNVKLSTTTNDVTSFTTVLASDIGP